MSYHDVVSQFTSHLTFWRQGTKNRSTSSRRSVRRDDVLVLPHLRADVQDLPKVTAIARSVGTREL
jgi:hypothetical protein